jgi:hypothetical protein
MSYNMTVVNDKINVSGNLYVNNIYGSDGNVYIQNSLVCLSVTSSSIISTTNTTSGESGAGALNVSNGGAYIYVNLYVGGTITTTSITQTSDYRIKNNVQYLTANNDELETKFDNLRPIQYTNKLTNNDDEFGFIAHELQEIFPTLVQGKKDDPNNNQSVNYTALIALLVYEVQQLKRRVNEQDLITKLK